MTCPSGSGEGRKGPPGSPPGPQGRSRAALNVLSGPASGVGLCRLGVCGCRVCACSRLRLPGRPASARPRAYACVPASAVHAPPLDRAGREAPDGREHRPCPTARVAGHFGQCLVRAYCCLPTSASACPRVDRLRAGQRPPLSTSPVMLPRATAARAHAGDSQPGIRPPTPPAQSSPPTLDGSRARPARRGPAPNSPRPGTSRPASAEPDRLPLPGGPSRCPARTAPSPATA